MRRGIAAAAVAFVLGGSVTFWWLGSEAQPVTTDRLGDQVQTVTRGRLPVFAPRGEVAGLYRFAVERGDVLRYMPCTCGCGDLGHTSNRACYVKEEVGEQVTFTSHAAT